MKNRTESPTIIIPHDIRARQEQWARLHGKVTDSDAKAETAKKEAKG